MSFVPPMLGVVLLLFGMASPATMNTRAKPIDACHLLTTAQASTLLGKTVTSSTRPTSTPECAYSSTKALTIFLVLRSKAKTPSAYHRFLHADRWRTPTTKKGLVAHHFSIAGTKGFYVGPFVLLRGTPPFVAMTFVARKDGYVVVIGIKKSPKQVHVGQAAMGDVLARLR